MRHGTALLLVGWMLATPGCLWTSAGSRDPDREHHYRAEFNYSDLKKVSDRMIESLTQNAPRTSEGLPPVVVTYGIANATAEQIDTRMIMDKIKVEVLRAGRARFIEPDNRDSIAREIAYQREAGRVNPDTFVQIRNQTGARYLLTGRLAGDQEREGRGIRFRRGKESYYLLVMEMVDLETSLTVWAEQAEVRLHEEQPILGW